MPTLSLERPVALDLASDDWTDDPSFDISPTEPSLAFPSSSSSSSSASSRSRPSGTIKRDHAASSPLRQSFVDTVKGASGKPPVQLGASEVDDLDGDFDFPDSFPALSSPRPSLMLAKPNRQRDSTGSSISSTSSLRLIPQTVVGQGPKGVGTITRLGSAKPSLPSTNLKSAAKAMEDAWEADVDFGDDLVAEASSDKKVRRISRLTLSPPRGRVMPDADALDDLGFDIDDNDNEATLKAGNTLKAMLPPRRQPKASTPPTQDDAFEDDLVLPLNMQNLSLIPPAAKLKPRPRVSNASTLNTDWDSPTTSTSGHKSSGGGFSRSGDSPKAKRASDTSATSVSGGAPALKGWLKEEDTADFDLEEDMESGLVLPSDTFFSEKRAKELNSILDRKRKPQFAPPTAHSRTGTDETNRTGDESMEDGLLLGNPRVELSNSRLRHQKRSRHANVGTYPPKGHRGEVPPPNHTWLDDGEEKAWQKQRERGWGRHTPVQAGPWSRDRIQPSPAPSGARSHSASVMATLNSFAPPSRHAETAAMRDFSQPTIRSTPGKSNSPGSSFVPLPPIPSTPSSSSRLRHQKSYHHLSSTITQSQSIPKKQSLASLRDAFAKPGEDGPSVTPPSTLRHQNNTASRLTMPTSSSRAKAKPPISQIFPDSYGPNAVAGPSHAGTPAAPRPNRFLSRPPTRMMEHPRRPRVYGDGSELEGIDDLKVEDEPKRGSPIGLGRPSRRGANEPARPAAKHVESEKRKTSGQGTGSTKRRIRRPAMLIKHLGTVDKRKVVGEMTWNPDKLRWEGNEGVLRDFDSIPTSASVRPALITHLGGSSGAASPSAGLSGTVKIVGDMRFDPEKMCWVSVGEEEPDPFADMADDEDEDFGGATITRSSGRRLMAVGVSSSSSASVWSSRLASESSNFSSAAASSIASGSSWEERIRIDSPTELLAECKEAEERHKREMKGWIMKGGSKLKDGAISREEVRDRERREEKRLWEIRNLALKS